MKALLLKAPKQLELVDLPRPELAPGQVRVRVRNVGVCGSDYSGIAGKLPFTRYPIVVGREASGEVLESTVPAWDPAMQLVASGQLRLKELITHRVDLAGAAGLLLRILDGTERAVKVMVSP